MTALTRMLTVAAIATAGVAGAVPRHDLEPRNSAAVVAADEAWGDAETRGDYAFVDWLLMPGYQSVSPSGHATAKAAIVAGAKRSHDDPAASTAKAVAWKAAHPVRAEVAIHGDSAVLTWVSVKPGSEGLVSSCDVFVYRDGHWHPVYSQHSELA